MEMEEDINNLDTEEDTEEEGNEMETSGDSMQGDNNGDEEELQFDITIAATHSYMGPELSAVRGRSVVEAGWRGRVPALAHQGCVFPGETVPLLLAEERAARLLARALAADKLFALLYLDETSQALSGWGVVCEVFEAAQAGGEALQLKARAVARVRAVGAAGAPPPPRAEPCEVRALPERAPPPRRRHAAYPPSWRERELRRLDAALTPWPPFVFDIFDFARLRRIIQDYFTSIGLGGQLPEEPVSLSFWAASNLVGGPRERRALFAVDCALLRLHMACDIIARKSMLCCVSCGTEIARREHVFAMSSDGVHSNYTNPSGYLHDVVTVRRARNVAAARGASREYSWFPGYGWAAARCGACGAHVGWRFSALARALRPRAFYGLCRDRVAPTDRAASS